MTNNQHKMGSSLKFMERLLADSGSHYHNRETPLKQGASVNVSHCVCTNKFEIKIYTGKRQSLFFLLLFLTVCQMLSFLYKKRTQDCCPEQVLKPQGLHLYGNVRNANFFPLNFPPRSYSKQYHNFSRAQNALLITFVPVCVICSVQRMAVEGRASWGTVFRQGEPPIQHLC